MGGVVRSEYSGDGLGEGDLARSPLEQVRRWVAAAEARQAETGDVPEPTALSVATVDADGRPNVRTVLLRFLDDRGPGFVTDLGSAKSREIAATGAVAAALTWPTMYRAIRFRGTAVPVGRDEIAAYFVARPWGSRISAWASDQSQPVANRAALVAAYERYAALYPDTGSVDDVPVPDGWGGWRIDCDEVELWAGRRDRLHDRLVYARVGPGGLGAADAWVVHRRQP
ncbi:pyridoxamine 5'-phosphate oxidase [Cellulomonas fengjieae]|uniref:Pyridoxamine 5'-phosphate oxidase n=1 Tax=Cellulomonas fengjieae TaxID=2819978 RepID=A0ABS3SJR9_9CELL|nr:pyridoxamine 5'-phosphate oxidase [Cellulomonas fengjieae]MBO3085998.1 pyridoxamine 5'-phosphate oxidase [Cellulomonas fengjieae]MBO3103947.1 pyridoxamine 5'-phosphate oxidase [Cellulomonas fengjieae]QVI65932.1 pyridoxamine 5'-phosphate oxidase [Cellulomonas fengjieae]